MLLRIFIIDKKLQPEYTDKAEAVTKATAIAEGSKSSSSPLSSKTTCLQKENKAKQEKGDGVVVVYASDRSFDRSGMVIMEQLDAHAYAFRNRFLYGGYCRTDIRHPDRFQQTRLLIQDMGWECILPASCPPPLRSSPLSISNQTILMNRKLYHSLSPKRFTPGWLNYMKRHTIYYDDKDNNYYRVAIHVRRGDVTPCKNQERYLPNWYYLQVLDRYLPPQRQGWYRVRLPHRHQKHVLVQVFSESSSVENWTAFENYRHRRFGSVNMTIRLDTPLRDVWRSIAVADMVILSKSSTFSIVPAMVNRKGFVLYPYQSGRPPIETWTRVSNDIYLMAQKRILELQQKLCFVKK